MFTCLFLFIPQAPPQRFSGWMSLPDLNLKNGKLPIIKPVGNLLLSVDLKLLLLRPLLFLIQCIPEWILAFIRKALLNICSHTCNTALWPIRVREGADLCANRTSWKQSEEKKKSLMNFQCLDWRQSSAQRQRTRLPGHWNNFRTYAAASAMWLPP